MDIEQSEQADILKQFEKGRRLFLLRNSEGWNDLLDILEAEVTKAEYRLMNTPAGSATDLLRDLHAHARAARSIFEQLQLRVNAEVEQGKQIPQIVNTYQNNNL